MREPTHPGFASSRFGCGCRVSHPLAALRLPRPSGPFRPVTLMGFPLRSLPLPRSRDASRRPMPSCRYPSGNGCNPKITVAPDRARLQGLAPRGNPWRAGRGLADRPLVAPLGFRALGLSCAAWHTASRALPSQAWPSYRSRGAEDRPLRVSIRSVVAIPSQESCNPSALLAPRFRSARCEPRHPWLAPTDPVTSLLR